VLQRCSDLEWQFELVEVYQRQGSNLPFNDGRARAKQPTEASSSFAFKSFVVCASVEIGIRGLAVAERRTNLEHDKSIKVIREVGHYYRKSFHVQSSMDEYSQMQLHAFEVNFDSSFELLAAPEPS